MSTNSPPVDRPEPPRFGYFLLQTRVAVDAGEPALRMTVEDLGSGDKWDFESTGDLVRFLEALPHPASYSRWASGGERA